MSTHFDLLVPVEAAEQDYKRIGVEVNDELHYQNLFCEVDNGVL